MPVLLLASPSRLTLASAVAFCLATAACSSADNKADTAATRVDAASRAPTTRDSAAAMGGMNNTEKMGGMAMTGDADRDFLRMMSDHHKGLVEMAHMTKELKPAPKSVADATKLDTKQDAELDRMQTMLEKDFKDPYAPKVMPDNQAMADALKGKTGADYDRTFYANIVKHHQEAIVMIDAYLPKAKNATVKQMAERMKADQSKEITEFQKKAAAAK